MERLTHFKEVDSGVRLSPFLIPREHGAWAMWIVPAVVGAGLAGANYGLASLFFLAALLLFWARYPFWVWTRSRGRRAPPLGVIAFASVMGLVGAALALSLAATQGRWALLWFGAIVALVTAIHLELIIRGHDRSLAAEFLGISALALAGPATYHVATTSLDSRALLAWLLPVIFFGASVFTVKLRVDGYVNVRAGTSARPLAAALLAYLVGALVLLSVLVSLGVVPLAVFLVYLPIMLQAFLTGRSLQSPPKLKRLGILWVGHSVFFVVLLLFLL